MSFFCSSECLSSITSYCCPSRSPSYSPPRKAVNTRSTNPVDQHAPLSYVDPYMNAPSQPSAPSETTNLVEVEMQERRPNHQLDVGASGARTNANHAWNKLDGGPVHPKEAVLSKQPPRAPKMLPERPSPRMGSVDLGDGHNYHKTSEVESHSARPSTESSRGSSKRGRTFVRKNASKISGFFSSLGHKKKANIAPGR